MARKFAVLFQMQLRVASPFDVNTKRQLELYVLAMLKRLDHWSCLKDRRPTDLFAAALFSFQGANSARRHPKRESCDRVSTRGVQANLPILSKRSTRVKRDFDFFPAPRLPSEAAGAGLSEYHKGAAGRQLPYEEAAPRSRCRRRWAFSWVPQVSMLHQTPLPFLVLS